MFRRGRAESSDLITFEVSADGVVSEPVVGEGYDEAAPPAATPPPRRDHARRQLIAAGSVLVVGLTAWGVTTAVREHERTERLAAAPGGVLDLSHPLATAWEADAESSARFAPGLVVVRRGTALHALDARTGDERWQAEVGGDPDCGPSTWALPGIGSVEDPIVCVHTRNTDHPTVTVVHADGSSQRRDLPADVDEAWPGADGGLVTLTFTGPRDDTIDIHIEVDDQGRWEVVGELPPTGPDAVVRLEDAATGETRWERTVTYVPAADVQSCGAWYYDGEDPEAPPKLDVTPVSLVTDVAFVSLTSCTWNALFTAAGDQVASGAGMPMATGPTGDGGFLEYLSGASGLSTRLHAPDGRLVATFDDLFQLPYATDGTDGDALLAGGYGEHLRRVTPSGETLWKSTYTVSSVLIRAAGVVVVTVVDGTLGGIDLATGEMLWTRAEVPTAQREWFEALGNAQAAFTDGTLGLVVFDDLAIVDGPEAGTYVQRPTHLVAFDLRTSEFRWEADRPEGQMTQLYSAAGRLFEVVTEGSTVISAGNDGTIVNSTPSLVRALR